VMLINLTNNLKKRARILNLL